MPSIRYYNQTAPFWDFIANLESSGLEHPFFGASHGSEARQETSSNPQENPQESSAPKEKSKEDEPAEAQDDPENRPSPPEYPHHHEHPWGPHPSYGHPWGPGFPFGARRGGPHPCGGPHKSRRWGGHCGGREQPPFGGWPGRDFDISKIGEFFAAQFGGSADKKSAAPSKDFSPPADVFDTEDAYIVHISLPGAKKEDVGVNWDSDKSELSVAGVIYRPGNEEFLKTLALDERTVGVFERKVRLGSRANPAQVDADHIAAKMEDGVLVVTIPKTDREYVDVKKVDVE